MSYTSTAQTAASPFPPVEDMQTKRRVGVLLFGKKFTENDDAFLNEMPPKAKIVSSGKQLEDFSHLTERDWADIEVIVTVTSDASGIENVLRRAKGVKWIHSLSAGVSHLILEEVRALNIPVTNGKGHSSRSLAEYALFACNYFAKNCFQLLESKGLNKWNAFKMEVLYGRTMGIIGLGDIGFSTAKIAKAFGMNIIGVRQNLELTEEEKFVVDQIYSLNEIIKVMGMSDYIVAALPLTERTSKLIDSTCIEAMQSHAVFINIGRGPTVDEEALIKALQNKNIRGAALDVFEVEPLPQTSPFYELENILISSHNAHFTLHTMRGVFDIFSTLLTKYLNGEKLHSFVDLHEGY